MSKRAQLEQMLEGLIRSGGSSLHLLANSAPRLRLHGKFVASQQATLGADDLWDLVDVLVLPDQRHRLEAGAELQTLLTTASGEIYRSSFMLDQGGPNLVFRRMPRRVPSIEALDLPDVVASFAQLQRGLVLVTGFLGSGKSTTLASLVDRVNHDSVAHIVTIEKPIEYLHQPAKSIVHQREVGTHVESFATGVADAVSQSADVIFVSDLPDAATLDAVFDAIERGALVLAGLRATSVTKAIEHLIGLAPATTRHRTASRLAQAVRAVVAQALLQRSNGRDRVPLLEILINNQAVRRCLEAGEFGELQQQMERGRGLGMQTVDAGLRDLLAAKLITQDEAVYHAKDRDALLRRGR